MRTVIILILLLAIKHSGLAQSTVFFKTYDFENNSSPTLNNVIEINNLFFLNGTIKQPNQKIFLIKVDNEGLLLDTSVLGIDTGKYYGGLFLPINSNRICALYSQEYSSPSYLTKQYNIYIDTNLVLIFDTLYNRPNTIFGPYTRIGNNYYFAGITALDNNDDTLYYYSGQLYFNGLIWKTDSNLNEITHNSIGLYNKQENLVDIEKGFDSNLLLGGLTLANGNQQDWYLVNVDTNGTVLGEYFYGHPTMTDSEGMKSISQGSDSTYYLAGKFYQYDFGPGNYYYAPTVVKIDRNFQTVWTKRFGNPIKGTTVNKILQTNDGNQALLVQVFPMTNPLAVYSQINKFNNNGDILWSHNYYQGDTTQYIRYRAWDMIETSDSGFALCGSAIDTINVGPYQQAWLVKTDSLGCDGLRSCNDTAMVVQILNHPDTLCKDSTYHIAVRLKGRSAPYSLFANGILALDSIYYPYTLPLWIDTIMPFIPQDTGWQNLIVTLHEQWERNASDTMQVYVRNCTTSSAPQEFYKRKVEIFPNPASTELHVKIRGVISGAYTITLYDIQGKPIRCITTKETETVLDISLLPVGVYGVKVVGNGVYRTERVVKGE
jgi:hypothetical protein